MEATCDSRLHPQQHDNVEGVLNDRQLRQINVLPFTRGLLSDFSHDGEHISSFTEFSCVKGFSEKEDNTEITILNHYEDTVNPPQSKQWQHAIEK